MVADRAKASELLDEIIKLRRELLQMNVLLREELGSDGGARMGAKAWPAYREASERVSRLVAQAERALDALMTGMAATDG